MAAAPCTSSPLSLSTAAAGTCIGQSPELGAGGVSLGKKSNRLVQIESCSKNNLISACKDVKFSKGSLWRHQFGAALARQNAKTTGLWSFSRRLSTVTVKSQLEEDVTIDNSTVLVAGGGGVGMEVVRILAKAGSWVTVFQRGEKFRQEVESLGAMLAIGDVMDTSTIEKALKSNTFDAVICTVGGGSKNTEVDKDGSINVIKAAKKAGVKRFILVSSIGVGDSIKAINEQTLQVLKLVLEAKFVAEEELKSSGLAYTIVRPGGLLTGPASGKGILTEDSSVLGLISRADVASLITQILFRKDAESKTFSAIDSERLQAPTTSLEGVKIFSLA